MSEQEQKIPAEGRGGTRFDSNVVTLSGRVLSKELNREASVHGAAPLHSSAVQFVLDVAQNECGATRIVKVPCKVQGGQNYDQMFKGDMIVVLGRLCTTNKGELYVKAEHWHLLEPRSYLEKRKEGIQ